MLPYALIDLHCDTLTNCIYKNTPGVDTLNDPARVLALSRLPRGVRWAQLFAVFLPDTLHGEDAIRFFDAACADFDRQMAKYAALAMPCRGAADMERAWAAGRWRGSFRGSRC